MDFLDRVKAFIVPYASTLFITTDGQAHEIAIRRETKKERVLACLRLSKDRERGYLAALMRDEGRMYSMPMTPSEKLAPRREQAGKKK